MPYSNHDLSGYFDYAAATPVDSEIWAYYQEVSESVWANPSSLHRAGRAAQGVLEDARRQVAASLGASLGGVIFLNSATSANNLVWRGLSGEILSSTLEHASLASDMGRRVLRVSPNEKGVLEPATIIEQITPEVGLVSLIWVQNELGTIQPIQEVARRLAVLNTQRSEQGLARVYLHTDAVQAANYLELNVNELGVDLLTLSAQKIYAPRGTAALYVRAGVPLAPITAGGGQERGLWSGTPDVAGIAAFARALHTTQDRRTTQTTHARQLQNLVIEWASAHPRVRLNTDPETSSPGHAHLSLSEVSQEEVLTYLDLQGYQVSAGSSCASGSLESSPVVEQLLLPPRYSAHLRLSFGRYTRVEEVRGLLAALGKYLEM